MQQNKRELVKLAVFALQSQGSISAVEFNDQNSPEEIKKMVMMTMRKTLIKSRVPHF